MTLEDYADVSRIVTGCVSVAIAYFVYRWQRQAAHVQSAGRMTEQILEWNRLVLEDKKLQEREAQNHRWARLSNDDVRKHVRSIHSDERGT